MKKVIFLVLSLCLLTACGDDDNNNKEAELEDIYKFESIQYYVGNGDKEETVETTLPSMVYENNTESDMTIFVYPYEKLKDSSLFINEKGNPYTLYIDGNMKLSTPIAISGQTVSTGKAIWPFKDGVTEYLPQTDNTTKMTISPNSKLKVTIDAVYKKLTVSYRATFIGVATKKSIAINGKWTGEVVQAISINTDDVKLSPSGE